MKFGVNTFIWGVSFGPPEFHLLPRIKDGGFDGIANFIAAGVQALAIDVDHANYNGAQLQVMITNGIVFEIRWPKPTCRNGAVTIPSPQRMAGMILP